MAGDISVAIAPSSLQRVAATIGGVRSYLERFTRDVLYQESALAARAFMKFTPPIPKGGGMGDTPKAKKQGEIAIDRDVRSFVRERAVGLQGLGAIVRMGEAIGYQAFLDWKTAGSALIKHPILRKIHADQDIERSWKKFKNLTNKAAKPSGEMGRPIKSQGELGQIHSKLKGQYKGRITQRGGPGATLRRYPYLMKETRIAAYIKDRQTHVGTMSHYWWQVLLKVPMIRIRGIDAYSGRKGVPAWIKRSPFVSRAPGEFIDNTGRKVTGSSSVTIRNNIGDIFGVAREARTKEKVTQYRLAAQAKRPWKNVLDAAIIKATRGEIPT